MFTLPRKQPNEIIKGLWVDFKNRLLTGETISAATVTGSVAGIAQDVVYSGTKVTWSAGGGTTGTHVKFTIRVTGSLGSVRETEATMMIIEE